MQAARVESVSSSVFLFFLLVIFFFVCFHSLLVLILPRPGCSISRAVTFAAGAPQRFGDMGVPPSFDWISHFHFFTIDFSHFGLEDRLLLYFSNVPTKYLELTTPLLLAAIALAASPPAAFLFLSNYMQ